MKSPEEITSEVAYRVAAKILECKSRGEKYTEGDIWQSELYNFLWELENSEKPKTFSREEREQKSLELGRKLQAQWTETDKKIRASNQ